MVFAMFPLLSTQYPGFRKNSHEFLKKKKEKEKETWHTRPSIKSGVFAIEEPIGLWGPLSARIQLLDPILGTQVE
jgi:hypothetical protein